MIIVGMTIGILLPLAAAWSVAEESPAAAQVATPVPALNKSESPKPATAQPAAPHFSDQDLEFFEKSVRPLLVKYCYECHSAAIPKPEGGLRLDSRSAALKGGDTGPAVVAGDPKKSMLIGAINYGDLYQMPPKTRLNAADVATLTKWVELGVPWPSENEASAAGKEQFDLVVRKSAHWCWQKVSDPALPEVRNPTWPIDPLDRFVLHKLEEQGLAPASDAQRHELIRRAYYDLHGLLPPTERVAEFVASNDPESWPKLVGELLASPRFGEHWGRHWLDLVRYSETYGHEFDYAVPEAWRYRDYVIRALNADVPYDQFAREHIAGDLLDEPRLRPETGTNESLIGTGFWFFSEQTHAPVDVLQHDADRTDNMVDVYSKTFLGVTVACARCHDHKFDAIGTRDYYALTGILRSTREQVAALDPHLISARAAAEVEQHVEVAREKTADYWAALPPETTVELAKRLEAAIAVGANGDDAAIQREADAKKIPAAELRKWISAIKSPSAAASEHPIHFARQLWEGKSPSQPQTAPSDTQPEAKPIAEPFRETFTGTDFANWFVTGNAFSSRPTQPGDRWLIAPDEAKWPLLNPGAADSRRLHPRFSGALRSRTFTITGDKIYYRLAGKNAQVRLIVDGYRMDTFSALLFSGLAFNVNNEQWQIHEQAGDLKKYVGHRAYLELLDHGDGWLAVDEISFAPIAAAPHPELADLFMFKFEPEQLKTPAGWVKRYQKALVSTMAAAREKRLSGVRLELFRWLLENDLLPFDEAAKQAAAQALQEHSSAIAGLVDKLPPEQKVLAAADGTGRDDPVYKRGNYKTLGEPVQRRFLEAVAGAEQPPLSPDHCGRLELAARTVDPSNPLFARVMANRAWQYLFGRGIVPTVDNFGVLGQAPSHPELLDRLATDFTRDRYSLKRMIRRVMLSRTYQMSSRGEAAADTADPDNQWLHKQRIRRVSGEALRDELLQLAGKLDLKMEGPSVPVHLTPFMQGRGRPGESGPLDGAGRRSIYQAVRRNFLSPLFLAFDTPVPFSTVGRRNVSNVPAQALILMNDPFVKQQAECWATLLLADQKLNAEQRLQQLFQAAWSRSPNEEERAAALEFLRQQAAAHGAAESQTLLNANAWADLCQAAINAKEFVFVR